MTSAKLVDQTHTYINVFSCWIRHEMIFSRHGTNRLYILAVVKVALFASKHDYTDDSSYLKVLLATVFTLNCQYFDRTLVKSV